MKRCSFSVRRSFFVWTSKNSAIVRPGRIAQLLLLIIFLQMSPLTAEAKKARHAKPPVKTCQKDKLCKETDNKKSENKMDKIITFTYHQSGGFAAINRGYSVKIADLGKDEADKLTSLIESSGLLKMKNERKTTPGAADMFFYEFSASNGGEHKATFDDGSLPDSFRPLLDFVRDKAKVEPRS